MTRLVERTPTGQILAAKFANLKGSANKLLDVGALGAESINHPLGYGVICGTGEVPGEQIGCVLLVVVDAGPKRVSPSRGAINADGIGRQLPAL